MRHLPLTHATFVQTYIRMYTIFIVILALMQYVVKLDRTSHVCEIIDSDTNKFVCSYELFPPNFQFSFRFLCVFFWFVSFFFFPLCSCPNLLVVLFYFSVTDLDRWNNNSRNLFWPVFSVRNPSVGRVSNNT